MGGNYAAIVQNNLARFFAGDLDERAAALPARREKQTLIFSAFGAECRLNAEGVFLDGTLESGPRGIIISLYGLHAVADPCRTEPWRSFKEMPDSAPYAGAFVNRTQQPLVPAVPLLVDRQDAVCRRLDGGAATGVGGDIAFIVRPLPKIALCYVCYLPDEDFPAGVTCLYANNADRFLPTDALADVGEYTTQAILHLLQ